MTKSLLFYDKIIVSLMCCILRLSRVKENVIKSFTKLTCPQYDFQLVLKQSNIIDELSENVSSLKSLVEKMQDRRVIVPSYSDIDTVTDTVTSQSAINTDYNNNLYSLHKN